MWTISVDTLAALVFTFSILAVVGFSCLYEFRDERYYAKYSIQNLFHCIKCNNIYSLYNEEEYCECPQCHSKNIKLKF